MSRNKQIRNCVDNLLAVSGLGNENSGASIKSVVRKSALSAGPLPMRRLGHWTHGPIGYTQLCASLNYSRYLTHNKAGFLEINDGTGPGRLTLAPDYEQFEQHKNLGKHRGPPL